MLLLVIKTLFAAVILRAVMLLNRTVLGPFVARVKVRTALSTRSLMIRVAEWAEVLWCTLAAVILACVFYAPAPFIIFLLGLMAGLGVVHVYFALFARRERPRETAQEPASLVERMIYSIESDARRPWVELVLMAVLAVWALYMLATRLFAVLF